MTLHHHTTGEPFELIYSVERGVYNTTPNMIVNGTPYKLSDGSKITLQYDDNQHSY